MRLPIPILTLLLFAVTAATAQAETFAVDRGDDDVKYSECADAVENDCTLRGALSKANDTQGADTITLPALRVVLDAELPAIEWPLTLAGDGARSSIIDGAEHVGTVLDTKHTATIRDLTVTGARSNPREGATAAVNNRSRLLLERVAITDNEAVGLSGLPGNDTTVVSSLIARNEGLQAGGISSSGLLRLRDSTVAGNTARPFDGSSLVFSAGVMSIDGALRVEHSTIARNRAAEGATTFTATNLGRLSSASLPAVVSDSIIAEGGAGGNCSGLVDSRGGNVDSDGSCRLAAAGDRVADAQLAPLADNGGPTDTIALLAASPALGLATDCSGADQRGVARPGSGCDGGAFESPLAAAVPTGRPVTDGPPTAADTTTPRLTVRGIPKKVTRKAFNAGLRVRVGADEPIAARVSLRAPGRRVRVARSLEPAAGTRTVRLTPARKLTGTRRVTARLRVVAFDGAGNRSKRTLRFPVR